MGRSHFADIIAIVHLAFVTFVLGGYVVAVAGGVFDWRWTRNRTLSLLHILAVSYTLARVWVGASCPLAVVEDQLRGANPSELSVVANVAHRLVFKGANRQQFRTAVTLFSALVFANALLAFTRHQLSDLHRAECRGFAGD